MLQRASALFKLGYRCQAVAVEISREMLVGMARMCCFIDVLPNFFSIHYEIIQNPEPWNSVTVSAILASQT